MLIFLIFILLYIIAPQNGCTLIIQNILQDFDKLNTEYKKLEFNYSSLLKTARAEIERKGEIIKNLNTE